MSLPAIDQGRIDNLSLPVVEWSSRALTACPGTVVAKIGSFLLE